MGLIVVVPISLVDAMAILFMDFVEILDVASVQVVVAVADAVVAAMNNKYCPLNRCRVNTVNNIATIKNKFRIKLSKPVLSVVVIVIGFPIFIVDGIIVSLLFAMIVA